MIRPTQARAARSGRLSGAWVLCCALVAWSGAAVSTECPAQVPQNQLAQDAAQSEPAQAQPQQATPDAAVPVDASAGSAVLTLPSTPKRQQREAEAAYLAGAKRLEHGDLDAAER